MIRVLAIEDTEDDYELMLLELRRNGYAPTSTRVDTRDGLTALLDQPWDVIVSDWQMPQFSGAGVLEVLAERRITTPCIIMSGMLTDDVWRDGLPAGAFAFVPKSRPGQLAPVIERALTPPTACGAPA